MGSNIANVVSGSVSGGGFLMKRILLVIIFCFFGSQAHADNHIVKGSDFNEVHQQHYMDNVKHYIGEATLALAMDANGNWAWAIGNNPVDGKHDALNACKNISDLPATCKIIDVGGKSDFMKNMKGDPNVFRFEDGSEYVGERNADGQFHGNGTYTWPDGVKYAGEWRNHKLHGQGVLTWLDGSKYVGQWKDGKEWIGTEYTKYGTATARYLMGKSDNESTRLYEECLDRWEIGRNEILLSAKQSDDLYRCFQEVGSSLIDTTANQSTGDNR